MTASARRKRRSTPPPEPPRPEALAIHKLIADGTPTPEAIDTFLDEHAVPLVEGSSVTFLFRGEADAVLLQHFIFGLPTSQDFERIADTDLWFLILELPPESRMQYKLNVQQGEHGTWILDPLNDERAYDPYGANSVCMTAGAERPSWTFPDPESRTGSFEELAVESAAFGGTRKVRVYLPARYQPHRRYPLLVVHDGGDYVRFSDLQTVLDNLIHCLEVAPMVVALIDAGDRLVEYPDNPRHAAFVTEELLPALEGRYPLDSTPAGRGLMGASFGGVAALSTAWRYQGVWGRLLLQSGSFAFTDIGDHDRGPLFDPVVRFVNAFRDNPGRPSERVFVSCGTYERLIYENRSLVPRLQDTGMDVRFVESRDGHNWANWRDQLRVGLSWLFPGPLWMVYE